MSGLPDIEKHYRTGKNDLSKDFFEPVLKRGVEYRRAAGYFSSSALSTWGAALPRMISDATKIFLLISPELSAEDIEALKLTLDEDKRNELRQIAAEKVLSRALNLENDSLDEKQMIFAWLIANNQIELRFAFPSHIDDPGIFHDKIGVVYFPDGQKLAFTGSANETKSGHVRNYESIDVYRSWITGDTDRLVLKEEQFNEAWDGEAEGLKVFPLSESILHRIRERVPASRPLVMPPGQTAAEEKWRHQKEGADVFIAKKRGILNMATGTGKTRTSLRIFKELLERGEVAGAIISTHGTDLLKQWYDEVLEWQMGVATPLGIHRQFDVFHEIENYLLDPASILIVSRASLEQVLARMPRVEKQKTLIIHDEVHGLGSESCVKNLQGLHRGIVYRLGLSATPEREYDEVGNDFLEDEIGPVIFNFTLEDAIKKGVLCPFDYIPLEYELTEGDRERIKNVYKAKAAGKHTGKPMANEEFWTKLARVYKTAEAKPAIFAEYLDDHPDIVNNTIIFVHEREYGDEICNLLADKGIHKYRTYYAEHDTQTLRKFAKGGIDCLITCHKVSQGIDIQKLEKIVLFAADRARLETIQRMGRCLRSDPRNPDKRATVVDFIRVNTSSEDPTADDLRRDWLTELSKVEKEL
jgi:superfamily II DNA or RNA helicase